MNVDATVHLSIASAVKTKMVERTLLSEGSLITRTDMVRRASITSARPRGRAWWRWPTAFALAALRRRGLLLEQPLQGFEGGALLRHVIVPVVVAGLDSGHPVRLQASPDIL